MNPWVFLVMIAFALSLIWVGSSPTERKEMLAPWRTLGAGVRGWLVRRGLLSDMARARKADAWIEEVTNMTEKQQAAISEADFKNWVMAEAYEWGWRRAHFLPTKIRPGKWMTAQQGDFGFPDMVFVRDGRLLMWELKKQRDSDPSPEQLEWLRELAQVPGVETGVYRPSDTLKIVSLLK